MIFLKVQSNLDAEDDKFALILTKLWCSRLKELILRVKVGILDCNVDSTVKQSKTCALPG